MARGPRNGRRPVEAVVQSLLESIDLNRADLVENQLPRRD